MTFAPTCWSCLSNAGINHVSPGVTIYEGRHWLVKHAYPTKLRGWLVLVLKDHKASLHDLTPEEFEEMGTLIRRTVQLIHHHFNCAKEYVMILAETEHFQHVHIHIVPRAEDSPEAFRGAHRFAGGKSACGSRPAGRNSKALRESPDENDGGESSIDQRHSGVSPRAHKNAGAHRAGRQKFIEMYAGVLVAGFRHLLYDELRLEDKEAGR